MFPLQLPSGLIVSALIALVQSWLCASLAKCSRYGWPLSTGCSDVDLNHILWKERFIHFFFFFTRLWRFIIGTRDGCCILQHSNTFCQLRNSLTTSESINHFQFFYMNWVFHFLMQSFIFCNNDSWMLSCFPPLLCSSPQGSWHASFVSELSSPSASWPSSHCFAHHLWAATPRQ